MDDLLFHNGEPLFEADIRKLNEEEEEMRKIELRRWEEDFKEVLTSTPAGRRILWWLMHQTKVFQSGPPQFNASAYGVLAKQEIGNDIIFVIGAEKLLESLVQVKKENLSKEVQGD